MPPVRRKRKQSGDEEISESDTTQSSPSQSAHKDKKRLSEFEHSFGPKTTKTPVKQNISKTVTIAPNEIRHYVEDATQRDQDADEEDDGNPDNKDATSENGNDEVHTPERTIPQPFVLKITQAEKSALIANLKLEVAERARRLRARYTTQAQYLRDQIAWRIDHVPPRMRNMTIGELLEQQTNKSSESWNRTLGARAVSVIKDVRRLSSEPMNHLPPHDQLVVAKNRPNKPATQKASGRTAIKPATTNTSMPPPPFRAIPPSTAAEFSRPPTAMSDTSSIQRPVSPLRPASPKKSFERPRSQSPVKTAIPGPYARPASPVKAMARTGVSKVAAAIKVYGGGVKAGTPLKRPASPVKDFNRQPVPSVLSSIRAVPTGVVTASPFKEIPSLARAPSPSKATSVLTFSNSPTKTHANTYSPVKNPIVFARPASPVKQAPTNSMIRLGSPVKVLAENPTAGQGRGRPRKSDESVSTISSVRTTTTTATSTTSTSVRIKGTVKKVVNSAAATIKPIKNAVNLKSTTGSQKENNVETKQPKPRGRPAKAGAALTEVATTKRVLRSKK